MGRVPAQPGNGARGGSLTTLANFDGIRRPFFIETGTNVGDTLANAEREFERCVSIEYNRQLYEGALLRFARSRSVTLWHGHSPDVLLEVIKPSVPTTFWLDAHYFGNGNTLGPTGQCPLLAELRAILSFQWVVAPIILIDDAYMFDDSVSHPGSDKPFWSSNESGWDIYRRQDWPRVEEIDALLAGYRRTLRDEFILEYRSV
jgi:hypothetical protein